MFQKNRDVIERKKEDIVLFFEVAPLDNADVFYSSQMAKATVSSLVDAIGQVSASLNKEIKLELKPKRNYSKRNNADYINLLKALKRLGKLVILDSNLNLYDVISRAKLVVAVPYSSPALIARELGVNSIFFAQDFETFKLSEEHDGIEVVVQIERLKEILVDTFCSNSSH